MPGLQRAAPQTFGRITYQEAFEGQCRTSARLAAENRRLRTEVARLRAKLEERAQRIA